MSATPDHPVALALIEALGEAIAGTSANRSGEPSLVAPDEVRRLFAPHFELERVASEDILDAEPRFRERGLQWLQEQAWLATRK